MRFSCIFLDFHDHNFVSVLILQFFLNISSTLGAEKKELYIWTFNQPFLNKPDKYELGILVMETQVEQPQGNFFPVDVVQENLPLVKGPR